MPRVTVEADIQAEVSAVWTAVRDVESYPRFMENVRSVEIRRTDGAERETEWSTLLKGSILEWIELEVIDDIARTIVFKQLSGDLDLFDGSWSVKETDDGSTAVILTVDFEIGIPLLADMLNPVAARALKENSITMLREIEGQLTANQS